MQQSDFNTGNYSTSFIAEKYPEGYDSYKLDVENKDELYAIAAFANYQYMLRAASISNQLKGFNRTIDNKWNVIDGEKSVDVNIAFNNFNKNYEIYVGKKYFNLKSNWRIGHPLLSAIIDNKLLYFGIMRDGPKFTINHKGCLVKILVLSDRHSELNKIMIPRKNEDKSNLLLSPMPGLLTSIFVKENQVVEENQPLAIIEAMKMENIINSVKKTKIKKINCREGDSLEVDQIILEFE